MFRGSVPGVLKSIISEHAASYGEDIYVGCSGALSIERTLADTGKRLHGNDVLLYSSAIGCHLAGIPLPIALSEEALDDFPFLLGWCDTSERTLATILICSRLAMSLGRLDQPYYARFAKGHEMQWERMHTRTVERIREATERLRLASFTPEDVSTWIDRVPNDAAVILYPPFFKGDFTSQFARLERMFTWAAPSYEELDGPRMDALVEKVATRRHWMVGRHERIPSLAGHLRAQAQTNNRGVPIYVYASGGGARVVAPRQRTTPVRIPRLSAGDVLGEVMTLRQLTGGEFSALRSLYMNRHISPGQQSYAVGVLIDVAEKSGTSVTKLIGVYALTLGGTMAGFASWQARLPQAHGYLLSDFPVSGSDYPRLAKLVLYAAVSREAQLLMERFGNRRYCSLVTTAFSDRPVSMKYRGVYQLLSRKEREPHGGTATFSAQAHDQQRYQLNYGSVIPRWTLAEGLAEWKKRHGARLERVA